MNVELSTKKRADFVVELVRLGRTMFTHTPLSDDELERLANAAIDGERQTSAADCSNHLGGEL